eukprot:COSAG01_NODE_3198_length_6430_cov_10.203759_7_plen_121_part_00
MASAQPPDPPTTYPGERKRSDRHRHHHSPASVAPWRSAAIHVLHPGGRITSSWQAVGTITHTAATVEVRAANLVRMMRTGTEEGGRGGGAAHVRKRHSALHQLLPTLSDACGSPVRPAGS